MTYASLIGSPIFDGKINFLFLLELESEGEIQNLYS